jgi:hypothetical protein
VETEQNMIAACGLDCSRCEIRRAPFDEDAAASVVAWYREQGWLEEDEGMAVVLERNMYCCGCLEDRTAHWSPDCWILQCCVDDRDLENCAWCPDFACERLKEWAAQNQGYAQALERLRELTP